MQLCMMLSKTGRVFLSYMCVHLYGRVCDLMLFLLLFFIRKNWKIEYIYSASFHVRSLPCYFV